jgi:hypothetical protein
MRKKIRRYKTIRKYKKKRYSRKIGGIPGQNSAFEPYTPPIQPLPVQRPPVQPPPVQRPPIQRPPFQPPPLSQDEEIEFLQRTSRRIDDLLQPPDRELEGLNYPDDK